MKKAVANLLFQVKITSDTVGGDALSLRKMRLSGHQR